MSSMHSHTALKVGLAFICVFLIVSCAAPTSVSIPPTETALPTATISVPTETALPTNTPLPTATLEPALARAQYAIDLQFNFTTKIATVDQTITYPNWTGETLNEVVLVVEPNLWSGGFAIKELAVDDQPVTAYSLDGQKLTVPLSEPLAPGSILTLTMSYELVLPPMPAYGNAEDVRPQIYGY